jgi:beta-phosphoglucomutase
MTITANYCLTIMFDLDGTLHNHETGLGNDIIKILNICKLKKMKIVLVSLNKNAIPILEKYNIYHYFDSIHTKDWKIYGKDKTDLFYNISKEFNISFENMLLFDDYTKHIVEARCLNIKTIQVHSDELLTMYDFRNGLKLFKHDIYKTV